MLARYRAALARICAAHESDAFDLLLTDAHLATMRGETPMARSATARSASRGEHDRMGRAPSAICRATRRRTTLDAHGGVADARARRLPHASRLRGQSRERIRSGACNGATYADIAREGGGIAATVRATRAASEDELAAQSRPRLAALAAEGVTTVEIKSGYGLDTANEVKQLRVARALAAEIGVDVRTTLLAAHALPPEFAGRADDYIDYVCRETIPGRCARRARGRRRCVLRDDRLHAGADATRVRRRARARVAGQAARRPALGHGRRARWPPNSARCRPITSNTRATRASRRWHAPGRSPSCCPALSTRLRETKVPPIAALRARGRAHGHRHRLQSRHVACRRRSLLMLNMACTLFRLTPEEALAGVTVHAARALGLARPRHRSRRANAPTSRCWEIAEPAELATASAATRAAAIVRAGRVAHWE